MRGSVFPLATLALLAGACSREPAPGDTTRAAAARDSAGAPATAAPGETEAYARHLDSLAFRHELRVLVHRFGQADDPDARVWGYYRGDELVIARGPTGHDSLPYARFYLRGGAPVLATRAADENGQWRASPQWTAWWYLHADTLVTVAGRGSPGEVPRLLGVLAAFRRALDAPGETLESASSDTLVARPRAPYVVHGACPFECCRLGDWTIESGATLRREPAATAPVAGAIARGSTVTADSALIRLDTLGLVVVDRRLTDQDTGIDFAPGDSVLLLDYLGEGFISAWLRGHRFQASNFWDSTGASGARLVRRPASQWWVHLSRIGAADTLRGWLDMSGDSVQVSGNDACGE